MKTRMYVSILILVLAVIAIAGNYATGQDTGKIPVELLYGTWVNPDNVDSKPRMGRIPFYFQKFVLKENKRLDMYYSVDDKFIYREGDYIIKNSWVDDIGNTYYQVKWSLDGGMPFYYLYKLLMTLNP